MSITSMFIHKFDIYRLERIADDQGGYTEDYVMSASVWGRMSSPTTAERQLAVTEDVNVTHIFYCPFTAELTPGDEIRREGKTYKVHSVINPSLVGHHLEARCEEIQE